MGSRYSFLVFVLCLVGCSKSPDPNPAPAPNPPGPNFVPPVRQPGGGENETQDPKAGNKVDKAVEERAVSALEKVEGRYTRSSYLPGNPITRIAFPNSEELPSEQIVETMKSVAALPHLQSIHFGIDTSVSDEALGLLRSHTSLIDLTVWSKKVTDTGMSSVATIKSLETLRLTGCSQIGDDGLKQLTALGKLKDLMLGYTSVTGKGLRYLAPMKALTVLELGESELAASARDDLAPLMHIKEFSALSVSDTNLQKVYAIPNLTKLEVFDRDTARKVTDLGLKGLSALSKLEHLKLDSLLQDSDAITETGLKELALLKNLTSLHVVSMNVGVAGLRVIAKCEKLTDLYLIGVKVTDEGLKSLVTLSNLTYLHLRRTEVTEAGVKELQKALPKCKISHD